PSRAAGSACTRPNRRDSKGSERGRRESTRRRADRPARKTHGLLPDASRSAISPATKAATVSSVASFKEIWWALRTRSGNTSWNNLLAISASSCVSICCSSSAFSRMGFFSSFALLISGDIAACLRWEWLELLGFHLSTRVNGNHDLPFCADRLADSRSADTQRPGYLGLAFFLDQLGQRYLVHFWFSNCGYISQY